jgi:hypothetical protein
MERVPKGRETREESLFFPVGTDRLARGRPAALDHPGPVSPVPGIGPAGLLQLVESSVPRRNRERPSPSAYLSCDLRSLCACEHAHVPLIPVDIQVPTVTSDSRSHRLLSPSQAAADTERADCLFRLMP